MTKASSRTASQIIADAESALRMAQLGLEAVKRNSPGAKAVGLRNVAVFGRSVTWVLQNLRNTMPKQFDHWYAPHADEMRSDPLIRFFVVLRNQIEKQGLTPPSSSTEFEAKKDLTLPNDLGPPPPGAESFFLDVGGAGWNVSIGSETQRFYVELPEDKVIMRTYISNAPTTHKGKPLGRRSMEELCELYVGDLQDLVADAKSNLPVV